MPRSRVLSPVGAFKLKIGSTLPDDTSKRSGEGWEMNCKEYEAAIAGALARGYCHEQNAHKELDSELLVAQLAEVLKEQENWTDCD